MFFGGGMPFMHPGMHVHGGDDEDEAPRKDVDTTKHYTTLGIDKDASQTDVKKAYMRLAKQVRIAWIVRRDFANGR